MGGVGVDGGEGMVVGVEEVAASVGAARALVGGVDSFGVIACCGARVASGFGVVGGSVEVGVG
ncbi:hypothetical protein C5F51_14270, partial [Nocardia nova]